MPTLAEQTKIRYIFVKKYAGVIIQYGDTILLGKRSLNGCAYEGYWSIPCGQAEKGEPLWVAAERELFEETGIKIANPLEYLWQFNENDQETFYVYLYKSDELLLVSPEAQDSWEHSEWGYFKSNENCLPQPISKEIKESILKVPK